MAERKESEEEMGPGRGETQARSEEKGAESEPGCGEFGEGAEAVLSPDKDGGLTGALQRLTSHRLPHTLPAATHSTPLPSSPGHPQ